MYVNNEYRPNVYINLDNGVYVFDAESASGKTYLGKHLKKLEAYGEPVTSFTYNDLLLGGDVSKAFGEYKVIMLDRYDLYRDIGHELMNANRDKSIILVDCKAGFIVGVDCEICFIELTKNNIEVSL